MIFLSWNCRGFGSKLKAEALKDLKKMASPSVILLQETKMDSSSLLEATNKIFNNTGGATVSSQGASGGIATLWNEQIWSSEVISETQNWILTVLKNKDNNNVILWSISTCQTLIKTKWKPGPLSQISETP
jgi:exonuclease III